MADTPEADQPVTNPKTGFTPRQQELVDKVVYMTSFVSEKERVDPMLNALRYVTSNTEPGEPMSAMNESILSDLYIKLQNYLVDEDPAHKFTKESLQQQIAVHFGQNAGEQVQSKPSGVMVRLRGWLSRKPKQT